jgi:hypothetical protein
MRDLVTPPESQVIWGSEIFDDALCEFAIEYADQNERDYRSFVRAVREERIQAVPDA